MRVNIATYGATIVNLYVPDRTGRLGDVVLASAPSSLILQRAHTLARSSGVWQPNRQRTVHAGGQTVSVGEK